MAFDPTTIPEGFDSAAEYMTLMEETFMWVYPEPYYDDSIRPVAGEWYAVHAYSADMDSVYPLKADLYLGVDRDFEPEF